MRSLLTRLPDGWRTKLALAAPRLPVARRIDDEGSAYDVAYFERLYATPDPWRFAEQECEGAKYALTLELCGAGPFDRALEIGCSEGVFTEMLAPGCRSLLALDISARAVARAQQRLSRFPQVDLQAGA